MNFENYEVVVNFSWVNDKWVVNLRSKPEIDVSLIAKAYGGGHKNAAGFGYSGNIFDIIKEVKNEKSNN